jgi:hypothetical protein
MFTSGLAVYNLSRTWLGRPRGHEFADESSARRDRHLANDAPR